MSAHSHSRFDISTTCGAVDWRGESITTYVSVTKQNKVVIKRKLSHMQVLLSNTRAMDGRERG
jgi:hypothetical protein